MKQCPGCAEEIRAEYHKCRFCGYQLSKPQTKQGPLMVIAITLTIAIIALAVITIIRTSKEPDGYHPPPPKQVAVTPAEPRDNSTGNRAHDLLVSLPKGEQTRFLARTAASACFGTRSFYMGMDNKDLTAYWSIGCAGGKSYEIAISADATGSTRIIDCTVLKIARISCFVSLSQQ